MKKFPCPACGAEICFFSSASVFGVCAYCRSTIVRHDLNLENLGKMADLPADLSPIQIGARGKYKGIPFSIIGRLRQAWADGFWNEWCALFEDQKIGWLAEAQGQWMMNFLEHETGHLPEKEALRIGLEVAFGKAGTFNVEDIKEATCVASEGELPTEAPAGKKSIVVDLAAEGNRFACLEYSTSGILLFCGSYVEFKELQLTGLRVLDGW